MYSVIFLGTPDLSAHYLENLNQDKNFEIKAVLSQKSCSHKTRGEFLMPAVQKKAHALNLNYLSFKDINSHESLSEIKKIQADLCFVIAFGQILKKDFLNLFPSGVFNLHASLLPLYRGAAPVERAIMNGDLMTGISLQRINERLDAGDILAQRKIEIKEQTDASEVYQWIEKQALFVFSDLYKYLEKPYELEKQNAQKVSWAHKIRKEESLIDWNTSCHQIFLKIKALNFKRQAYFIYQGKRVRVIKAKISQKQGEKGEIIDVHQDSFVLGCKTGAIEMIRLQPESKNPMSAGDFIRGFNLKKKDFLK